MPGRSRCRIRHVKPPAWAKQFTKEYIKRLPPSEQRAEKYLYFSAAVDTSYSQQSPDTIAMSFLGITNKGRCIVLDEKVYNNAAAAALERIEHELIDSMMRNLRRHLKEESDMGFDWEQWQVLQLKYLEAYRKKNQKKYGPQFSNINRRIRHAIEHARVNGQKEEEVRILKTLSEHPELQKKIKPSGNADIQGGSFFKINEQKLDALIKATDSDMTKAEHAVLRRCDDQYRRIIFDAQMYANTGAGTVEKAIDMATHDFIARGIDSIVYKNGARHTISDYADMAIRTAERRAALMGAGETRKEWGLSLVIVNRRGTMTGGNFGHACPKCIPWLGKVLIDDVYSGGRPDGEHQLVSTAMQQGFLHPRCKDSFHTYYPGITSVPDSVTKEELREGAKQEKRESEQQYAERQAEKYTRLAENSLDPDNQQKYEAQAEQWREQTRICTKKATNRSKDREQHERYRRVLGEKVPKSLESFQRMKYTKISEWNSMKHDYRIVNSYEINAGSMAPEKILQMDDIAFTGKKGLFTGKAKQNANIAVMELDGKVFYANSKATKITDPAYYNFKGNKSQLVLMKPVNEQRFETKELGHKRNVDSEAKLFEYIADIAEDGKTHYVSMLSERCMCDSCLGVMKQFQDMYPNVTINVVSGRKDRVERNGNNPWKRRK